MIETLIFILHYFAGLAGLFLLYFIVKYFVIQIAILNIFE